MADGVSTEIVITRRAQDGWYTYTCDQLPGLFVANKDDRIAYEDLPRSIVTLIKLDLGIDCVVGPKVLDPRGDTVTATIQRIPESR